MKTTRTLSKGILALTSTVWGASLLAGGLWVAVHGRRWLDVPPRLLLAAGLAASAGGLFVFMVLVADRWFPRASRRVIAVVEWSTFVAFVVAGIFAGAWLIISGTDA